MRRSMVVGALVTALVMALAVMGTSAPAQAAKPKVTIAKIATKTAPYKGKASVRPLVRKSGRVTMVSKRITVRKGGRVIVRNKARAKLAPGTYRVTQKARYRTWWWGTRTVTRVARGKRLTNDSWRNYFIEECVVTSVVDDEFTATCSVFNNSFNRVGSTSIAGTVTYDYGWATYEVAGTGALYDDGSEPRRGATIYPGAVLASDAIKRKQRIRRYSAVKSRSKSQKLVVKRGAKPRTCATQADYRRVQVDFAEPEYYGDSKARVARLLHNKGKQSSYSNYSGDVIEFRDYRTCRKNEYISVGFWNGDAYTKSFSRY